MNEKFESKRIILYGFISLPIVVLSLFFLTFGYIIFDMIQYHFHYLIILLIFSIIIFFTLCLIGVMNSPELKLTSYKITYKRYFKTETYFVNELKKIDIIGKYPEVEIILLNTDLEKFNIKLKSFLIRKEDLDGIVGCINTIKNKHRI